MFLANNLNKGGSLGGYQISRSLRFNSADSAYLNRTPATTTNRKTWTWSGWVKRGKIGDWAYLFQGSAGNPTGGLDDGTAIRLSSVNNQLTVYNLYNSSSTVELSTQAVFRDPSAWYHIVVAMDTTQATSTDRIKVYVNGTQITVFGTSTYPTQNEDLYVNTTNPHLIGALSRDAGGAQLFNDGYMTEINFIDGQALTPSSFGETNAQTGVWQPKAYSGSYGTNGFYLNFSDNSNTTAATLGKDYSGNGNNWTPNGFLVSAGANNDSLVDSPTSYGTDTGVGGTVRGNYCTLNPLYKNGAGTPGYSNGNLDMLAGGTGDSYFGGTFTISSGKWYYECLINSVASSGGTGLLIGICKTSAPNGTNVGAYRNTSEIYNLDGTTQTAGATYATGDLIGVAFDIDAGTVQFYKNGTAQGATPSFTFTAGTEVFVRGRSDGANPSVTFNFGQRAFTNTAPSGYKALCTQNLPTPTIGATSTTLANKYFDISLWTGNGSSQTITNSGSFQPDWVWTKGRSNADSNVVVNAIAGANQFLVTESTQAEATSSALVSAFTSSGFSIGSSTSINRSSSTYVGWQWKANGSGSTNTAGSITSTVSANTTSGFSVVTWTGNATDNASVGHGLGVAPKMVIIKNRSVSAGWPVYTNVIDGSMDALYLNLTDAKVDTGRNQFTSSVFYVSSGTDTNGSGNSLVAYCFAEVAGYSKFGSYTGNGSTDGPFVYTGMRPAYIMFKRTNTSGTSWNIFDTSRSPYNVTDDVLFADLTNAEVLNETTAAFDILSNGFKLRTTGSSMNGSGDTYIFMAFASAPFKYSLAR